MLIHNRKAVAALALAAVATVPLIATGSDPAVAATSSAPSWAIQPGGTLTAAVANGNDPVTVNFAKWGGTIQFDPDSPGAAAIHIDVDLTGAKIGDSFKDDLLQGDEFFGTASTPTATYDSTSVEARPDGRFVAHGNLKLHGVAMAQDVEFRLSGSGAQRHVEGNASIDRLGYAIGTGSHGNDLGNAVTVKFAFDAKRG
jgi:polyisoprenoid-binding protein YceI